MIKLVLLLSTIVLPGAAHADIFRCYFAKPFLTVTYSMAQQKMTTEGPKVRKRVFTNVRFHVRSATQFELKKDDKVLMSMKLSRKGSDGETYYAYPYEAMWNGKGGGCESNFLIRRR
jgi:hypothetical protein